MKGKGAVKYIININNKFHIVNELQECCDVVLEDNNCQY